MEWQPFDCSYFSFLKNNLTSGGSLSINIEHRREKQTPFQCLSSKSSAANAKFVQHPYGVQTVRP